MSKRLKDKKRILGEINNKKITAFYQVWHHGDNYYTEEIFPYKYQYGKQTYALESALRLAIVEDRQKRGEIEGEK